MTRTAIAPAGQRPSSPMPSPTPCSKAVATTNPAAYTAGDAPAGISIPCAYPWNIANPPTITAAAPTGARQASTTAAPSTNNDPAIIASVPGTNIPERPIAAPTTISNGKHTGSHSPGRPNWDAQRPTATIAKR